MTPIFKNVASKKIRSIHGAAWRHIKAHKWRALGWVLLPFVLTVALFIFAAATGIEWTDDLSELLVYLWFIPVVRYTALLAEMRGLFWRQFARAHGRMAV